MLMIFWHLSQALLMFSLSKMLFKWSQKKDGQMIPISPSDDLTWPKMQTWVSCYNLLGSTANPHSHWRKFTLFAYNMPSWREMPLLRRKLVLRQKIWSWEKSIRAPDDTEKSSGPCRVAWEKSLQIEVDLTSVGSDLSLSPSPSPKGVLTHYSHWSAEDFGDSLDSHMVPMSPWPLHGGEQEKQMKPVVIRQQELRPARQRSSNAFSQIQSGTWHAKAIFNRWIYFFPIPSSSTSANFTESGQNPNQFQVFRETQKRLFRFMIQARKQNLPLDPGAKFSCFSIE